MAAAVIGLPELPRQTEAVVVEVGAGAQPQDTELVLRLIEIGFLPGERVRVIAQGHPGNDPLAVRIGQSTFALRRHEAQLVRVRLGGGA
jgi:ferrous iron transport protein A